MGREIKNAALFCLLLLHLNRMVRDTSSISNNNSSSYYCVIIGISTANIN